MYRDKIDALPDGAVIAMDGEALVVCGRQLLRWTPSGYSGAQPRPYGVDVDVLTPPSIVAVLKAGFAPLWHSSAK
jgi:hypothetical protein